MKSDLNTGPTTGETVCETNYNPTIDLKRYVMRIRINGIFSNSDRNDTLKYKDERGHIR